MGPAVRALMTMVLLISVKGMSGYMRVCYYTNWAQYRHDAKFFPENIPASLCTHIFYASAKLTNNTIKAMQWNDDDYGDRKGMFTKIMGLKTENPSMKILLSIGGQADALKEEIRYTANDIFNRSRFIHRAIQFLRQRNFDGLDIDWEFPRPEDQYLELMRDLKIAFIREGLNSKREPLLLAAEVYGNAKESVNRYRMAELGLYMDIVGIMPLDEDGFLHWTVQQPFILYPRTNDVVNLWLSNYFPPEKLVLGIATYGRSFTLYDEGSNTPDSISAGDGIGGPSTREPGLLSYFEICTKIQKDGWTEEWDPENEVPYAYSGNQWVGYDNEESLEIKHQSCVSLGYQVLKVCCDIYLSATSYFCERLAARMDSTVCFECGWLVTQRDDRLLNSRIAANLLQAKSGGCNCDMNITGFVRPENQSTTTTSTTTTASTNSQRSVEVDCTDPSTSLNFYTLPGDCTAYIVCYPPHKVILTCPHLLLFSPKRESCYWPSLVLTERTDC